jgi:hypothetical protein
VSNFLDMLLRDSAVGEHFCPTESPTFVPATARRGVLVREPTTEPRAFAVLTSFVADAPTWEGDDFLHALLRRSRPSRDLDRFTEGLASVAQSGTQSDPLPILF